jgi:hypothetical protein
MLAIVVVMVAAQLYPATARNKKVADVFHLMMAVDMVILWQQW